MSQLLSFAEYIILNFKKLGLNLVTQENISNDEIQLVFKDKVYGSKFTVLAIKIDGNKEFWSKTVLVNSSEAIAQTAEGNSINPFFLIVSKSDAEIVLNEFFRHGIRANIYNIFEGFSLVGIDKDNALLLLNKRISDISKQKPLNELLDNEGGIEQQEYFIRGKRDFFKNINSKKNNNYIFSLLFLLILSFLLFKLFSGNASDINKIIVQSLIRDSIVGVNGNDKVLESLGENANLTDFDYFFLSNKGYIANIAKNPNLNLYILNHLMDSKNYTIRASLALNPALTAEMAEKLSRDISPLVRANIGRNKLLSNNTISRLVSDNSYMVRLGVLSNSRVNEKLLDLIVPNISLADCETKERVFASNAISLSTIRYNSNNEDSCVRRGIALSSIAPTDIIDILSDDEDLKTRLNAIASSKLSSDRLNHLNRIYFKSGWYKDRNNYNKDIRNALILNPHQDIKLILDILNKGDIDFYGASLADLRSLDNIYLKRLYNPSFKRKGLNYMISAVNSMINDKDTIERYSKSKNINVDHLNREIRRDINILFLDSLYDPISLVMLLDGANNIIDNNTKRLALFRLDNGMDNYNIDGDPFTLKNSLVFFSSNEVKEAMTDLSNTSFSSYFEGANLSTDAGKIVSISDSIVDSIVDIIFPYIYKNINHYEDSLKYGATDDSINFTNSEPLDGRFRSDTTKKIKELANIL